MTAPRYLITLAAAFIAPLAAQQIDGTFNYRMITLDMGAARELAGAGAESGTLTFDDNYTDLGGGSFLMADPADESVSLNARISSNGEMILAASTESTGIFTLLTGVRAAAALPAITGQFRAVRLDIVGGATASSQTTFGMLDLAAATVSIAEDGSGTISDPLFGSLEVQVSSDGDHIIGTPFNRDGIFIASRASTGPASGLYWLAEFSVTEGAATSSIGSLMTEAVGRGRVSQRVNTVAGSRDFRGVGALALNPDGTGVFEATPIALAAGGSMLGATQDSILIGIEAPGYLGLDPFLHPHGVVNAASLSPAGNPVAPDTFVSLYGNGLGGDGTEVRVNGAPADVVFASPLQVNARVRDVVAVPVARVQAIAGGAESNTVTVPMSVSSPAVFTADYSGAGAGMITHADYSLVSAQAPARRGEIVLIWAAGLGVEQPAPRVLIGGVHAEVLYAGAHPSFPGLYQMNVRIPATAPTGNNIAVTLLNAEGASDTVEVAVTF